jgi:CheY-like chemotaxis protein
MHTILVVDDDAAVCRIIKAMLEAEGDYTVLVAMDGKPGLKIARRNRPDLILLDIALPTMDGISVLKELRHDPKTEFIPVVMVTASADEENIRSAMSELAEHYIVKPFSRAQLLDAVEKTLALRSKG